MSKIPKELKDRTGLFLPYSITSAITVGEVRELKKQVEVAAELKKTAQAYLEQSSVTSRGELRKALEAADEVKL